VRVLLLLETRLSGAAAHEKLRLAKRRLERTYSFTVLHADELAPDDEITLTPHAEQEQPR
jgi:hypothetical protein